MPSRSGAEPVARVAYQGEPGAYSELAATQMWGPGIEVVPSATFEDVLRAVATGAADYGVIPVENTVIGPVPGSEDALAAFAALTIVRETIVVINHCLLALPATRLEAVDEVLSHPAALAQCQRYLARHPHMRPVAFFDTAGAAHEVADRANARVAAIAGAHVASRYDLAILAADIADHHDNRTRFVGVAPRERG